jgi:hypothetical protein
MSDLDEQKKELRHKMELFHALEALKTNQNFRKLILLGFMQEEVINLNRMAANEMTAEAKIARSQQAQAAPVLENYLSRVFNDGQTAREQLPELDRMIDQEAQEET